MARSPATDMADQRLGLGGEGAVVPVRSEMRVKHLLAEVGASQEARVEACVAHHVVELVGVEAVEHPASTTRLRACSPMACLDGGRALCGAGGGQGLGQGHAGQFARPSRSCGMPMEPGPAGAQLAVAVADKDPDPGLLVGDVAEAPVLTGAEPGAQPPWRKAATSAAAPAASATVSGMSLGSRKAPATKMPGRWVRVGW